MSIRFNIHLKSGHTVEMQAICFGVLNKLPRRKGEVTNNCLQTYIQRVGYHYIPPICNKTIQDVSYDPQLNITDFKHEKYQEVLDDLPMFEKGFIKIDIKNRTFKVHCGNNPMDKVMMGLMFCRTICYFYQDGICMYTFQPVLQKLVDNGTYSPRLLFLANHFVRTGSGPDRYFLDGLNETSLFNTNLFGKASAKAFVKQEPVNWYQKTMRGQSWGYTRDNMFIEQNKQFNKSAPLSANKKLAKAGRWDEFDVQTSLFCTSYKTRYRKLVDCFTAKLGDEPLLGANINEFGEFNTRSNVKTKSQILQMFDELQGYIDESNIN
jgi:hypothetical protein